MAFLFLLMSLICTGVKEWIEGIFKWRAMDLERALRTLLDDKEGKVMAELFAHPMISSLFQGVYEPKKLKDSWLTPGSGAQHIQLRSRRNLPSYIPAAHFAKAFLDFVARGKVDKENQSQTQTLGPLETSTPDSRDWVMTVDSLRQRAMALESVYLRRAVLTAIDHSGGDLQQLTLNIQRWFDGSMDRASGWYKRRTQSVLFIIGLLIAILVNVDALHVMQRLTSDKTFREVVVNAAAKVEAPSANAQTPAQQIEDARNQILKLGMPVGWLDAPSGPRIFVWIPSQMCKAPANGKCAVENIDAESYKSFARPVIGWLITAFAVMLGAPFWFDVLNKFMVIRSTVKPHEKSPEEGSEDRTDKKGKANGSGNLSTDNADGHSRENPGGTNPHATQQNPIVRDSASNLDTFTPNVWKPEFSNTSEVKL